MPIPTEEWAIDRPVDHPENYREHTEAQLRQIRTWLSRWGFIRPIVVQKSTERIISGHGVREAARGGKTGIKTDDGETVELPPFEAVPVVVRDCDDGEARQWLLFDNFAGQMARDDEDGIRGLIQKLGDQYGEDNLENVAAGFTLAAMADAMAKMPPPKKKRLELAAAPPMTWLVIAAPTARWGELAPTIEALVEMDALLVCEVSATDG
jgi:ParB-like chromosome segregation protein Spo0J